MNSKESMSHTPVNIKPSSIFLLIFLAFISLTFFHCANMQTPTGGPKDSIPPKLLSESVPNLTRNFNEKQIILTFDEYIKLNNYQKEFSITPDVEKQPDFKVKKKSLVITLPDSLEENTTYTINFGKGLVDYNESNPILNYTYVFSTGPELDSLTITGSVINAYTKTFDPKADLNTKILLIPTRLDSIFGKKKANIFTNVDSSGHFKFNNLREDTYRIYALKEENNDRIYNNPDELLGFLADSIILNKNIDSLKIQYSKGKPLNYKTLEKKIEKDGRILLKFNQAIDTPLLKVIHPQITENEYFINYSTINDSAYVYLENLDFDSIKFELRNNLNVLDTILIRRGNNDKYERTLIPKVNITNKVNKIEHITLSSNFQIANIDKEKIILTEDSVSRRNFQLQRDTINNNLYHIRYNWKAKKNYELTIEENAISSVFKDTNKELKLSFTLDDTDNFGDINFIINNLDSNTNYLVQFIDEKKEKVFNTRRLFNQNELKYTKFPGGKYMMRIIKDVNNNGRWDGANIYTQTQAEPIWYLEKPFTIRANWEQSETITPQFE